MQAFHAWLTPSRGATSAGDRTPHTKIAWLTSSGNVATGSLRQSHEHVSTALVFGKTLGAVEGSIANVVRWARPFDATTSYSGSEVQLPKLLYVDRWVTEQVETWDPSGVEIANYTLELSSEVHHVTSSCVRSG